MNYGRVVPVIACMVPRKMVVWTVFFLAIFVIFSFLAIEVRKLLAVSNFFPNIDIQQKQSQIVAPNIRKENSTVDSKSDNTLITGVLQDFVYERPEKFLSEWDINLVENLFAGHPQCINKPFLLSIVVSSPENFSRRSAIRKTWGRQSFRRLGRDLSARTVFLIGQSKNRFLNILVENECLSTGDILVGKYIDSYRNLTLKVLHGLFWAQRHCSPNYLLKTDDDCFVNLALLLQFLSLRNPPVKTGLYAGHVRWSPKVVRDNHSHWFVSKEEFSGQQYPPYVSGAGYVLSRDVLNKLVKVADKRRPFPNEDAYVGLLLNVAGVRPTHSARFVTHSENWQLCNYLYLLVIHHVSAAKQSELQAMADTALVECPISKVVREWV